MSGSIPPLLQYAFMACCLVKAQGIYFLIFKQSPRVADGGDGLQIWRVAENSLNKQLRTADKWWYSSLDVELGAENSSPYRTGCYDMLHRASEVVSYEHSNEPSGSISGGEFLDWMSDC
jgi:hypothetical protein